jgi:hypothetical protein
LTLFCAGPPELNEGRCFFFFDRHGDVTSADRTLKPSPIAPALKPSGYRRAAFRALGIGVAVVVCVVFRNEFAFRHEGLESKLQLVPEFNACNL